MKKRSRETGPTISFGTTRLFPSCAKPSEKCKGVRLTEVAVTNTSKVYGKIVSPINDQRAEHEHPRPTLLCKSRYLESWYLLAVVLV